MYKYVDNLHSATNFLAQFYISYLETHKAKNLLVSVLLECKIFCTNYESNNIFPVKCIMLCKCMAHWATRWRCLNLLKAQMCSVQSDPLNCPYRLKSESDPVFSSKSI